MIDNEFKHDLAEEAKKCSEEIDRHENVMDCPCCIFFLNKRNRRIIEEKISQLPTIPDDLTIISVPIIPSKLTKSSYSLYGIETIANGFLYSIYNILGKTYSNKVFFKVFYKRDPLYTIPVIVLEIFLLKQISNELLGMITERFKQEFSLQTGSIPSFEIVALDDFWKELKERLDIPLLLGTEIFKRERKFSNSGFSNKQIQEMNFIHGIPIYSVYLSDFEEDRGTIFLGDTRGSIQKENDEIHQKVSEAINKIFEKEVEIEPVDDEFPF
jgi:hypothetical protein